MKINLENLNLVKDCYGAEWTAKLRNEFKARGFKGVTLKSGRGGYTDSVVVTVKMTSEDYNSLEELIERDASESFLRNCANGKIWIGDKLVDLDGKTAEEMAQLKKEFYSRILRSAMIEGHYYGDAEPERRNFPGLTESGFYKLWAAHKIASCAHYVESDSYTDYYNTNYYLELKFVNADGVNIREQMTDKERQALEAEREAERIERERQFREYEKHAEIERQIAEEHRKQREQELKVINSTVRVSDLDSTQEYTVYNIVGGHGKESNLEELNESIAENPHQCKSAKITREIELNKDALKYFQKNFLCDFDFLQGFGGCICDDKTGEEIGLANCVAVYCDNKLVYVVDPEGFNYARYVYKTAEAFRTDRQNRQDISEFLRQNGLLY